jgi:hypothetical protein
MKSCFSFFNRPGATNDQICIDKKGNEINAAVKNATFTLVKKASWRAV